MYVSWCCYFINDILPLQILLCGVSHIVGCVFFRFSFQGFQQKIPSFQHRHRSIYLHFRMPHGHWRIFLAESRQGKHKRASKPSYQILQTSDEPSANTSRIGI